MSTRLNAESVNAFECISEWAVGRDEGPRPPERVSMGRVESGRDTDT